MDRSPGVPTPDEFLNFFREQRTTLNVALLPVGVGPIAERLSWRPPAGIRDIPVAIASAKRHDARMATVLIVDDHETFRSFAKDLLQSDGFEVVAEAEDGASGIELATQLRPDLVLLDVQLPDLTGFEVAQRLTAAGVRTIVLISSRDAASYGDQIESSGAVGFVPKAELSGDAVRALLDGTG